MKQALIALMLISTTVRAEEFKYFNGSALSIAAVQTSQTFVIYGGKPNHPLITISLKDGKVTFDKSYTPDEISKEFWRAVEDNFNYCVDK